ncbi:Hypothetical predicted protein [Marmota monax]|uniref:Uncharacterized protein n=1 Tax=Marmota monax TaxID=9995 RepID=A0A5E4D4G9_MARMO|nr:hypothetical protein GHT09_014625 [Marmota monax]VTJ88898.1 Hypothetical predicted protein [Marmota monax]
MLASHWACSGRGRWPGSSPLARRQSERDSGVCDSPSLPGDQLFLSPLVLMKFSHPPLSDDIRSLPCWLRLSPVATAHEGSVGIYLHSTQEDPDREAVSAGSLALGQFRELELSLSVLGVYSDKSRLQEAVSAGHLALSLSNLSASRRRMAA